MHPEMRVEVGECGVCPAAARLGAGAARARGAVPRRQPGRHHARAAAGAPPLACPVVALPTTDYGVNRSYEPFKPGEASP